jgi:hypothetical protein
VSVASYGQNRLILSHFSNNLRFVLLSSKACQETIEIMAMYHFQRVLLKEPVPGGSDLINILLNT